ncbi:hypothetical protein CRG98_048429 [Punica granatum]|uniref:Uncharacterized protein n=1 Tax=Punica granatum TaxID=22663 RepID=A0A2I0HHT8_PUNGR|nr:hypothetical protein CRG98_048429 [Punica granatum]
MKDYSVNKEAIFAAVSKTTMDSFAAEAMVFGVDKFEPPSGKEETLLEKGDTDESPLTVSNLGPSFPGPYASPH